MQSTLSAEALERAQRNCAANRSTSPSFVTWAKNVVRLPDTLVRDALHRIIPSWKKDYEKEQAANALHEAGHIALHLLLDDGTSISPEIARVGIGAMRGETYRRLHAVFGRYAPHFGYASFKIGILSYRHLLQSMAGIAAEYGKNMQRMRTVVRELHHIDASKNGDFTEAYWTIASLVERETGKPAPRMIVQRIFKELFVELSTFLQQSPQRGLNESIAAFLLQGKRTKEYCYKELKTWLEHSGISTQSMNTMRKNLEEIDIMARIRAHTQHLEHAKNSV